MTQTTATQRINYYLTTAGKSNYFKRMSAGDSTKIYPSEEAASKVAKELQSDDPEWAYKVFKNNYGWIIQIFDEDNKWVANFS